MSAPQLDGLPLSPKQIQSVVESQRHRISIWTGAVRSGKTVASLVAFLVGISRAPSSGLIIASGRTLQTIERNLIEPLQDPALFGPVAAMVRHTRGSSTAIILGRTVHLIGAADVRAEEKLRGLTAYLILLDEATLLPEEYITQALARLSVPGARCLMTTNPAGPRHPLRTNYLQRAGELDLVWWQFSLDDNPALPADYVDAIKAEFTGLFYRRMVQGEWVLASGVVYDMFDEDHIIREMPPLRRVISCGIDWGSTNPTHAVLLAETDDRRLIFTREYRHDPIKSMRALTVAELSSELGDWLDPDRPQVVAVDPSAKALRTQLEHDKFRGVRSADNTVLEGIMLVGSLLSSRRLVIHESCKHLIDEMSLYEWDDRAAERGEDKPLKLNDHGQDSARYALMTSRWLWERKGTAVSTPSKRAAGAGRGTRTVPTRTASDPRRSARRR